MHTSIERHFDGIQMINICKRSYITHQDILLYLIFFIELQESAFRVIADNYVTDHCVCLAVGIFELGMSPTSARQCTRSPSDAGVRTTRSGGAPMRPPQSPSTASARCTAPTTVQESM
ncbi:uncharacterized protein [Zea mays]|uniref:uncharacterized protein isoform X1 n=1 Tax=Zea mays TaxID=4577 RepID=UPI0004DECB33|nr:uncharacterized protein LOC103632055 isoform X1 [Zea mays]|eukprot:XP_008652136.1 uncharacterized protein LOC103632055 isoform X1 [Zea mays]